MDLSSDLINQSVCRIGKYNPKGKEEEKKVNLLLLGKESDLEVVEKLEGDTEI